MTSSPIFNSYDNAAKKYTKQQFESDMELHANLEEMELKDKQLLNTTDSQLNTTLTLQKKDGKTYYQKVKLTKKILFVQRRAFAL